jgi:hypothetical protein
VLGNVIVNGNSYTIESETLVINDRVIGLANNNTSHLLDVGIIMQHPGKMLGGGYHFMQLDGKYIDNNNEASGFNYHTIKAVDRTDPDNLKFEDTSFEVNLGTIVVANTTEIEIKMNLAEWFKNPNTWNLNELNTILMPNFEAQKMMRANGESVFSLGIVN